MAEKKKNRYGVWFILILLLVGLAGFGANGLSGNIRSIGTVGAKDISVTSYQRTLNEQIRALQAQFGTTLSFQQAQAFGIDQAALSQIILTRTLDNEASDLGISVGDALVLERVIAIPQFRGSDGAFNRESYRFALQQNGQSEAEFEADIREDLTRSLLQGAVVSGVPTADAYADTLVQYIGERRSITWTTIDATALTAPVPGPTEADQQTYYGDNPALFTLPETRDITYAWLSPDMIQGQMTVTDEAVRQLYEDRSAEFIQPERRLVERLVYVDQAKAENARARLDAGSVTFEGLVAERGLNLSDIDLGDVDQAQLRGAGEAVFAADPGAIVGPFNSSLGPALFRVNAVLAAQETTFEEAAPDLRNELAADAAREVINGDTDTIIDLLAGGATLEDLAERTNMQLGTINWAADDAAGIAAYEAFRTEAALIEQGAFPEVFDLDDGGIFALRLDGITPPKLQPIVDVRDAVIAGWQAKARQEAVVARAEEIVASIQPLTDFATLGLEPLTEAELTRRSFVEGTPPDFNDALFEMAIGEVRVIDALDRAIIVRLDDIAPPDPQDATTIAQRESLAANAAAGIAQDIFDAYATQLRQQTDININQATVNAVNAQFQ
ncbi:peptidylprolyl isomerase [Yoonia sp.]|uniref:peptidylprolyl isomerase n=1 Tax=Yoonia sp. TaxID=2212373 RepID=UPI0025E6F196|nr:peptidylprolyl isomerase [Yoonia sp.]